MNQYNRREKLKKKKSLLFKETWMNEWSLGCAVYHTRKLKKLVIFKNLKIFNK